MQTSSESWPVAKYKRETYLIESCPKLLWHSHLGQNETAHARIPGHGGTRVEPLLFCHSFPRWTAPASQHASFPLKTSTWWRVCRSGTGCLHAESGVKRQRPHCLAHLFNCICPLAECGYGTALSINKVRSQLCSSWESQPFLNGHCYALHHELFSFLISLFISVSVCLGLSMWLDTPEVIRGSWAPGTEITDVCEPANTDAGNRVQFLQEHLGS